MGARGFFIWGQTTQPARHALCSPTSHAVGRGCPSGVAPRSFVFPSVRLDLVAVATLVKTMNLSVNPCDDFYQFVCGRYVRDTPFPSNLSSVSVVSQLEDVLRVQLRELLAEPLRDGEPATFTKAKALYRSCMNTCEWQDASSFW